MAQFFNAPSKVALDWLKQDPKSGSILSQVRRLQALQADVNSWTSSRQLRLTVSSCNEGVAKIFVSHPAILSRFRQQVPGLIEFLQSKGWQVSAIEAKVQAKLVTFTPVTYPKTAHLGPKGRQAWAALKSQLSDEHLKKAAEKLCDHHGIADRKTDKLTD